MDDQLDNVIDDAVAVQPTLSDTGVGIRSELQAMTPPAPVTVDGAQQRLSRKGELFDPAVHASPPVETARGTWRKLSRGVAGATTGPSELLGPERFATCARETCGMAFDMLAPLLDQLFPLRDKEWQPSPAERDSIEHALQRFYERYPEYCVDLPPGIALVCAVGVYALPRVLALPAAQALLARTFQSKQAQHKQAIADQDRRDAA